MHHNEQQNQELIGKCIALVGVQDVPLLFDSPVIVKTSPHTELYRCYGCVVTLDNELKLMNVEQQWDDIKPAQANAGYVLQTLHQRLKSMKGVSPAM